MVVRGRRVEVVSVGSCKAMGEGGGCHGQVLVLGVSHHDDDVTYELLLPINRTEIDSSVRKYDKEISYKL